MTSPETSLFSAHPSTGHGTLIQYHEGWMNSVVLMTGYADAARRLRDSYSAQPWDDVILFPFLFVWRQAIELALKKNIGDLAELRRQNGDPDPSLERVTVEKRLRSKIGHDMEKLIAEHEVHNSALGLQDLPEPVNNTLRLLAALDNGGTGFRYAGVLDAPSADINFASIGQSLDEAFSLLEVVIDAATQGEGVHWGRQS